MPTPPAETPDLSFFQFLNLETGERFASPVNDFGTQIDAAEENGHPYLIFEARPSEPVPGMIGRITYGGAVPDWSSIVVGTIDEDPEFGEVLDPPGDWTLGALVDEMRSLPKAGPVREAWFRGVEWDSVIDSVVAALNQSPTVDTRGM